jgi:hypothetical protein
MRLVYCSVCYDISSAVIGTDCTEPVNCSSRRAASAGILRHETVMAITRRVRQSLAARRGSAVEMFAVGIPLFASLFMIVSIRLNSGFVKTDTSLVSNTGSTGSGG